MRVRKGTYMTCTCTVHVSVLKFNLMYARINTSAAGEYVYIQIIHRNTITLYTLRSIAEIIRYFKANAVLTAVGAHLYTPYIVSRYQQFSGVQQANVSKHT